MMYLTTQLTQRNAISKYFPDVEINEKKIPYFTMPNAKTILPQSKHVGPCMGYGWRVCKVLYTGEVWIVNFDSRNIHIVQTPPAKIVIIMEEVIKLTVVLVRIWLKRRKGRFRGGDFKIILVSYCASGAGATAADTARDWRTENLNRAT